MADHRENETKKWVETWVKAAPKLEAIRDRELRELTYEDRIRAIDALLQLGTQLGKPRTTSGLVEQQRLFQKLRK